MNSITQSFLLTTKYPRTIKVRNFARRYAGNAAEIAGAAGDPYLGFSVSLSASGEVSFIAVATPGEVFLIATNAGNGFLPHDQSFKDLLSGATSSTLVGFEMARLAIQVGRDLGTPVHGIDLGTLCSPNTRDPWRPGELMAKKVCSSARSFEIDNIWSGSFEGDQRDVCLRAWISACAAEGLTTELDKALRLDTSYLDLKELYCLGELVRQADLLEAAKPKDVPNEFTSHKMTKDGTLSIVNSRYRTRIRRSNQTTVIMTDSSGREYTGRANNSSGKKTGIKFTGPKLSGTLASVRVVGRQDLTNAEKACNEALLLFLRRQKAIRGSVFARMVWFPSRRQPSPQMGDLVSLDTSIPLNDSQQEAVRAMLSDFPLVIVHGPPGTGKTTAISAAASIWDKHRQNAWIVAHSNVGVKNIAEKLLKNGVDFKIIVSKEFHFEWHEHIYGLIGDNLIRTDELPKKAADTQKVLGSSCIVLSTLSTLSNPALMTNGLFKLVPVDRLVVDEASQIKIFDFMSVFAQFSNLKKVCFFGDPNQLPPYGQETVPNLQTIFDLPHLHHLGKFLDTQYRMPVPIGDFISKNVYNGRLHSKHPVTQMSCVSFINVAEGVEDKGGFSWRNFAEIRTIVHLVRSYYRHKNFCVITPYDAQRAAIEKALKDENLPWECVFNVDSFQGNEAKFVLISVVRSGGPGFLTSLNRMNVMLTRCQAGLVVVTSRSFLHRGGWNTLLGRLARHWEDCRGDEAWVEWRSVAAERVDLPGAPGRNKTSNPFGFINRPPATVSFSPQPTPSSYYPSFPQAHFVGPIYGHDGYGFKHYIPPASSYYPTIHSFMGGLRNAPINRPAKPLTYDNYDEAFPSLLPMRKPSVLATVSPPANPHSFLNAKPKPPKVSKPQEPIRSEPAPVRYHPPPPRAHRRAPQPKYSENHWQPVTNNHTVRNQRYTLTNSGYRL